MPAQALPPSPLSTRVQLQTPVLFLVFNRPDTTARVFEAIRQAKPPRLYVAADGPREGHEGEVERVAKAREIATAVDWPCEVKTLFREKNLGCKYGPSSGITWFFTHEEQGIILEDDCLPNQSFFWFCQELLDRYKDDFRVGGISGSNFQGGIKRGQGDYYFSIYNHIWGWATWASRWKQYQVELENIPNAEFLAKTFKKVKYRKYWEGVFWTMKRNPIDTWDYQWIFTLWSNGYVNAIPNTNLIINIGFRNDATHTKHKPGFANLARAELSDIRHPLEVRRDEGADEYFSKLRCSHASLPRRLLRRLVNAIRHRQDRQTLQIN